MGVIVPSPAGSVPMDTSQERAFTLLNQTTVTDATGTDFDVTSMATARLTVVPTSYSGTVTFYASADGTTFDVIRGYKQGTTTVATSVAHSSSSTATIWEFPVSSLKLLRIITSGSSSGTSIKVVGRSSPLPSVEPIGVTLSSAVLAAGTAVIGSTMIQSVSGTALGADASNTELKVSAYGKSSAAGDTAIGVDSSGAVKLAAGSNLIGSVTPGTGKLAAYTYAISATAPYATPTDWIVIRGSGTKTVKIQRIELSGAATAATEVIFTIKKHTIANTGGTSTTPTPMQHDSADAAASAVVLLYSAAPTVDASATIWKNVRMDLAVAPAATSVAPDRFVYDYGLETYEPLTLRGVAQELAINFAGAAVPTGGVYDVAITFSEE